MSPHVESALAMLFFTGMCFIYWRTRACVWVAVSVIGFLLAALNFVMTP
jgi:hypothetical protein